MLSLFVLLKKTPKLDKTLSLANLGQLCQQKVHTPGDGPNCEGRGGVEDMA